MAGNKRNVPAGTRDIMFEEARLYRSLQNKLTDLYTGLGFSEIMTPGIEHYDVFEAGSTLPQESMFKLTSSDGRLLVLRADNTTPIARAVACKLSGEGVTRLFYHQRIYRLSEGYKGRRSEIMQSGVEILGAKGIQSDLVCMQTALETMAAVCPDYKLEIGHVGYYNAMISELELDTEQQGKIRKLVEAKDANKIENYGKIKKIPFLFGGAEVFSEAADLAKGNSKALSALEYLKKIYTALCDAGYGDRILIDLGIVHSLDYYTGVVMKGYMAGAGEPVLAGGRYDTLLSKFDRDVPATGFGLNVSEIADTLTREKADKTEIPQSKGNAVYFDENTFSQALEYVKANPGSYLSALGKEND